MVLTTDKIGGGPNNEIGISPYDFWAVQRQSLYVTRFGKN